MRRVFLIAVSVCLVRTAVALAHDAPVQWPPLPTSGFIAGRIATAEDVKSGLALFLLSTEDTRPLNIKVPQYALLHDQKTGKDAPVIIVQAEVRGEGVHALQVVGCISVPDKARRVGMLEEFKLLGTDMRKLPPL